MPIHARPVRPRVRAARVEARVTADQKGLIERAAALQGRTITDFVLASVQEAYENRAHSWAMAAGALKLEHFA